jgi:hypothetical protein
LKFSTFLLLEYFTFSLNYKGLEELLVFYKRLSFPKSKLAFEYIDTCYWCHRTSHWRSRRTLHVHVHHRTATCLLFLCEIWCIFWTCTTACHFSSQFLVQILTLITIFPTVINSSYNSIKGYFQKFELHLLFCSYTFFVQDNAQNLRFVHYN